MLRRKFLMGIAVLSLMSCSTGGSDVTVQSILDQIKTTCGFTTTVDAIMPVILTIVTVINAQAGAAATVAASVGKQVVDAVCNAVNAQVAQAKTMASSKSLAPTNDIVVVVNGVKVPGTYTGK